MIAKYKGDGDFEAFVIEGDTYTSRPFEGCFEKLKPLPLNAQEVNLTRVASRLWLTS